jgi:hypothetical protein
MGAKSPSKLEAHFEFLMRVAQGPLLAMIRLIPLKKYMLLLESPLVGDTILVA